MELVLQFGWMSTARQQFNLVQGPDQENTAALNEAVDEYAMGAAFEQQLLDPMTPTAVMQVAPPHDWYGQDVGGSRILFDNPDTIYRFMGVNATSSYVITGRFTGQEMPADTSFSVLTGLSGTTASVLTGRELVVNPDGSFTISVEQFTHRARAESHPAHLRRHLDRGAKYVVGLERTGPDEPVDRACQRAT